MKRLFDFYLSIVLLIVLSIPIFLIATIVMLTSKGPVLHWSRRVGKNNKIFMMPKFRTMYINTPLVATHMLKKPAVYVTRIGRLLRKTSLDELPQLVSITKGDMSFVGPRPALFNQDDLIELRTRKGIHRINPGLTGLAQINGRDEISIPLKVEYDTFYLTHQSFYFDMKIITLTAINVILRKSINN